MLLSVFILFDEKLDYLVSGSADDGREDSSRGVVPGESRLAHSGAVVHNQSSNIVVTHVLSVLFNKTNVRTMNYFLRIIPRGLIVLYLNDKHSCFGLVFISTLLNAGVYFNYCTFLISVILCNFSIELKICL